MGLVKYRLYTREQKVKNQSFFSLSLESVAAEKDSLQTLEY